jgi:hypothetical protein
VARRTRRCILALTVVGGLALTAGTGAASATTTDRCSADDPGGFAGVLPDSAAAVVLGKVPPGCGRQNLAGVLPDSGGLATGFPIAVRA